eukprot:273112_1
MSDLSVEIQVASKNKQIIGINQLILVKSESTLTCLDVLNMVSKSSPLLQHVLTYIRHYASNAASSEHKEDQNENDKSNIKSKHIEIIACKDPHDSIGNVPCDKPLYPLLKRHGWNRVQFLISNDLMHQSQVFLSCVNGSHVMNQHTAFAPIPHVNTNQYSQTMHTPQSLSESHASKEFGYRRFFARKNPLDAFEALSEMSSLYHICTATLILWLTGILTNEALDKGVLHNFELLRWNFGQLDKVFLIWCSMFGYSFLFVVLLNHYKMRSIDRLNLGAFYCFLIIPLIVVPFRLIRRLDLPAGSAAIIACEQIRLIMKIHAYMFEMFRALHVGQIFHVLDHYMSVDQRTATNQYKYLENDWIEAWQQCMSMSVHPQQYSIPYPQMALNTNVPVVCQIAHYPYPQHVNSFFNFLFCPSLVYRWSYPTHKTKAHANGDQNGEQEVQDSGYNKVNWSNVFKQMVNMGGCLLFVFVVFYSYICPTFVNSPYQPFTASSFLNEVFSSALPGMLVVIMCFWGVVHCWLHTWSELTGYCDTVFYEDWWNANTFASYSKKWNLVVYNWSYNYFFLPMLEAGYSKATADLFTFWLWGAVQEYVFFAVSGCFYPVLLCTCFAYGLLFYSVAFMDTSVSLKYHRTPSNEKHNAAMENGNVLDDNETTNGGWNVFLWIMLFLQNGFFVTLYAKEWYAHKAFQNGQIILDKDSFLPYSWQTGLHPNSTSNTF